MLGLEQTSASFCRTAGCAVSLADVSCVRPSRGVPGLPIARNPSGVVRAHRWPGPAVRRDVLPRAGVVYGLAGDTLDASYTLPGSPTEIGRAHVGTPVTL